MTIYSNDVQSPGLDRLKEYSAESFTIIEDDFTGEPILSIEQIDITPLGVAEKDLFLKYSELVSIEQRIHVCGVSMRDVASMESLCPGIFAGKMPANGFTFESSMQNAEIALEVIDIRKIAMLVTLASIVVKISKAAIEWLRKRVSDYKSKRAKANADKLNASIKKTRVSGSVQAANARAQMNRENGNSTDTTSIPKPGGASHDSEVKSQPRETTNGTPLENLFNNVFVERFGVPKSAWVDFQRARTAEELLRVINRAGMTGPSIFTNEPEKRIPRLINFIAGIQTSMGRSHMASAITQQIDGFIAGNTDESHLPDFDKLIGPINGLTNGGYTNLTEAMDHARTQVQLWFRESRIENVALLASPRQLVETINSTVTQFNESSSIETLTHFSNDYERCVKETKTKLEQLSRSETDKDRIDRITVILSTYLRTMQESCELFRNALYLHGRIMDFTSALAAATALFMEN